MIERWDVGAMAGGRLTCVAPKSDKPYESFPTPEAAIEFAQSQDWLKDFEWVVRNADTGEIRKPS